MPNPPGIHLRDRMPKYVVFVPLVLVGEEYNFLFEKRAQGIPQGGEICFPGGRFEPQLDATKKDTAVRETVEELGIEKERLSVRGQMDCLLAHTGGFIDVFIGTIDWPGESKATPNRKEVERVFQAPVSYFEQTLPEEYQIRTETQPFYTDEHGVRHVIFPAKELGLPERYWNSWGGRLHTLYVYRHSGEVIWGITAELVLEVVRLLA